MADYDLKNKRVFLTGASSGIGLELARELAAKGAYLALGAPPTEEKTLAAVAAEVAEKHQVKTWPVIMDLTRPDGPRRAYEQARDKTGGLDVLINNAGAMAYGHFHQLSWEKHELLLSLNARAYMALMHLALADMIPRKEGRILNVVSASAFSPTPHHAVYGATKVFVQFLSEAVREEIREHGVTITTLNPGYVDTPLLQGEGFPKTLWWYRLGGMSSPAWTAKKAIKALIKGRPICSPGFRNRLSQILMPRLLPRLWTPRIAYHVLKSADSKAQE